MDNRLNEFTEKLDLAIAEKFFQIEKSALPELKEQFQIFLTAYRSIYNVLISKSMITEDPYKHEQKISDVTLPSRDPFMESEKAEQISIRMSDYETQLDFLCTYYQFSVEFLNMKRLKLLAELTTYIKWERLVESSNDLNTRVLSDYIGRLKAGSDKVSTGIVNDAVHQLEKGSKAILSTLKKISEFNKERYKLSIRKEVIDNTSLRADSVMTHMEEAVKLIKKKVLAQMPGTPFYPELVREIFLEDFAPESEQRRADLMRKLAVEEDKPQQKKKEDTKIHLIEALKALGTMSNQLLTIQTKLEENSRILEQRRLSFGEKMKIFFSKIIGTYEKKKIYTLEIIDESTGALKTLKLNLPNYLEGLNKKYKLYSALGARMSNAFRRASEMTDDALYDYIEGNINEMQINLKKMEALDLFFKSEIPKAERNKIKGIKIEITAIKNSLAKARQKRQDYVSRKEESEQLRRLGINMDTD